VIITMTSIFEDSADIFSSWSTPFTPRLQRHLYRVYGALCLTTVMAAVGAYAHVLFHIGGMLTSVASIALIALITFDRYKVNEERRLGYLVTLGLTQGASIGPLIQLALYVDPSAIAMALLLTANVFVCLTATAFYSSRRSVLLLGSVLSTALSMLLWISLFSLFVPTILGHAVLIYGGLMIFCGYLLYDTQMILEKGGGDNQSYVDDALTLFIDAVGIFVRLLIILLESSSKDGSTRRRRSRSE